MGLVKALEHRSNKKWLRELWVFNLEKRRVGGNLILLCSCLRRACSQVGGLVSYLKEEVTGKEETASSCSRGGLDWILEVKVVH